MGTHTTAPTIIVAEHAGACYGVERALAQVHDALRTAQTPVRTLGPLIHNPTVVQQLAEAGVTAVSEPGEAAGATLVLRTHGVTPAEKRAARTACAGVIDATCPFVVRAHRAAAELADAGYQVLVVGEAGHPEVDGTLAHAAGARAVGSASELAGIVLGARVGIVVQTTQTRDRLREVVDALVARPRVSDLRVIDTICAATAERQASAAALARRVDAMIVVGGRNSANTRHLAEICAAACPGTHHVESAGELDPTWLLGAATIGVTGGASTPQSQIDEVRAAIVGIVGA